MTQEIPDSLFEYPEGDPANAESKKVVPEHPSDILADYWKAYLNHTSGEVAQKTLRKMIAFIADTSNFSDPGEALVELERIQALGLNDSDQKRLKVVEGELKEKLEKQVENYN